ncbi:MAG: glycosyltransferase family 39 protein [Phycisphaerae bacterium]|jgi:hypothetical protein
MKNIINNHRLIAVGLLVIVLFIAAIRIRLLSIPLERDEGEYAYIAQMMLKGVPPFISAYSMKLPGIYAVYALIFLVFGQSASAIHFGLLIANIAAIILIFLLTRRLFDDISAFIAACSYAVVSLARPVLGLSANAEHFVLLPVLTGFILLLQFIERRRLWVLFFTALLFGLAFIIKQHAIFFGIFAAFYLLYSDFHCEPFRWKNLIAGQIVFAAGAVIPFVVTCFIFWRAGVFDKFLFWTFIYAGKYASVTPLQFAPGIFFHYFSDVFKFSIPIWIFALSGLFRIFYNSSLRKFIPFISGLLFFSFLSICPGFYFRSHYFIFLLPVTVILSSLGFLGFCVWIKGRLPRPLYGLIAVIAGFILIGYALFEQRMYLFDGNSAKVCRLIYKANPFLESQKIAEFITANSDSNDTIAVIGSEPQIYFYSRRKSATRYIYTYPLMEPHDYAASMQKEMMKEIESAKPKFLVFVNIQASWLVKKDSITTILKWFESYSGEYYDVVGVTVLLPNEQSIYRWQVQARDYRPSTDTWLAVCERKQ